jgi:hypothetical protein
VTLVPHSVRVLLATALLATGGATAQGQAAPPPTLPRFSHVVVVFLENESATASFEDPTGAPHLAALRRKGLYAPHYYGVGHNSLSNYQAVFAGVEPTATGKADCLGYTYGQCVFPASVPTLGALLGRAHLPWKVYSEGMTGAPGGHDCLHAIDRHLPDTYQGPLANGYAARHNPAVWFDSVLLKDTNESYCRAHSVDLERLWADARSSSTLPTWSFVEPDTCHDAHDTGPLCALDPEGATQNGGIEAFDTWVPNFVQRLTSSPAWDRDSLLVLTADEGQTVYNADNSGCTPCHDRSAGGRIGALFLGGRVAHPGTTTSWYGDHYSLLRTWESAWGLPTLKSRAATPAAAATVHDGDPGVRPLTGVWR